MQIAEGRGFVSLGGHPIPRPLTIRMEDANGHMTLSLADDDKELMLLIDVNPEVKKILRRASK